MQIEKDLYRKKADADYTEEKLQITALSNHYKPLNFIYREFLRAKLYFNCDK